MKKSHTTYTTLPETHAYLQALAVEMGIFAPRGPGAGKQGSASALLDYIGQQVAREGPTAIARRLEDKMDEQTTTVFYGFHAADLFDGWDAEDSYDERASADKYAALVKAELSKQYPYAEVEVEYDTGAGGVLPYPLQTKVGGMTDHDDIPVIEHIAGQVYRDFEWCVKSTD